MFSPEKKNSGIMRIYVAKLSPLYEKMAGMTSSCQREYNSEAVVSDCYMIRYR